MKVIANLAKFKPSTSHVSPAAIFTLLYYVFTGSLRNGVLFVLAWVAQVAWVAWLAYLYGWRANVSGVQVCVAWIACLQGWRACVGGAGGVLTSIACLCWVTCECGRYTGVGGVLLLLLLLLLKYYHEQKNAECSRLKKKFKKCSKNI